MSEKGFPVGKPKKKKQNHPKFRYRITLPIKGNQGLIRGRNSAVINKWLRNATEIHPTQSRFEGQMNLKIQ